MRPSLFPLRTTFLAPIVKSITAVVKSVTRLLGKSGLPIDFGCRKVAKEDHKIPGHGNPRKFESIVKHPNFDERRDARDGLGPQLSPKFFRC